jgi:hypothetical protein
VKKSHCATKCEPTWTTGRFVTKAKMSLTLWEKMNVLIRLREMLLYGKKLTLYKVEKECNGHKVLWQSATALCVEMLVSGWTKNPFTGSQNVTGIKCPSRRIAGWTLRLGRNVTWSVRGSKETSKLFPSKISYNSLCYPSVFLYCVVYFLNFPCSFNVVLCYPSFTTCLMGSGKKISCKTFCFMVLQHILDSILVYLVHYGASLRLF